MEALRSDGKGEIRSQIPSPKRGTQNRDGEVEGQNDRRRAKRVGKGSAGEESDGKTVNPIIAEMIHDVARVSLSVL